MNEAVTTKTKPEIKKPERLNLKGAQEMIEEIVRENKEWLKEMADK